MDLSFLQIKMEQRSLKINKSFNPCSYGSFVLTENNLPTKLKQPRAFQSLFLWIFRSYLSPATVAASEPPMFQSLFLWIFRSYLLASMGMIKHLKCFNPCSYGSFVLTFQQ